MLKNERLQRILDRLNQQGLITVQELVSLLKVSDMTVRRDLDELEKSGHLIRVHGGAQSLQSGQAPEKHNSQKLTEQIREKTEIAKEAAKRVTDGETIFLGPGTTIECLAKELLTKKVRIVTNSLPVFNILLTSHSIDVILIGGKYREITGAFIGSLADQNLQTLTYSKVFVSANAVYKDSISTYSETEGKTQQLSIDRAIEKYLLVDHTKFGRYDFFPFYSTSRFDAIFTDSQTPEEIVNLYQHYATIVQASPEDSDSSVTD